jgi:hypothetical protein
LGQKRTSAIAALHVGYGPDCRFTVKPVEWRPKGFAFTLSKNCKRRPLTGRLFRKIARGSAVAKEKARRS